MDEPAVPGMGDEPPVPGMEDVPASQAPLMEPAYPAASGQDPYAGYGAAQPLHADHQQYAYNQYYYAGYQSGAAGETGAKVMGK